MNPCCTVLLTLQEVVKKHPRGIPELDLATDLEVSDVVALEAAAAIPALQKKLEGNPCFQVTLAAKGYNCLHQDITMSKPACLLWVSECCPPRKYVCVGYARSRATGNDVTGLGEEGRAPCRGG
jgi:hypothetical protein